MDDVFRGELAALLQTQFELLCKVIGIEIAAWLEVGICFFSCQQL